jgi:ATP-binding cassette subfamily B multidrug efflux pump
MKELRALLPRARKYAFWYAGGMLFLAATSGLQLLIPQFVRQAIDMFADPSFKLAMVIRPVISIIITALAVAFGRLGWRMLIQGAARRIEAELREDYFRHCLRLGRSFFQAQKIGDLMALATNDLNAIRMAMSMALVAAFDGIFMSLGIIIILISSQGFLSLIYLIPLPIITFLILFVGRFIGPLFRKVQESFGAMTRQVQEIFSGIRVIQSFAIEELFLGKFSGVNKNYQKQNMSLVRIWGLFFPIVGFLSGLTTLLLITIGGQAVIDGTISPGTLVSTITYLQLLIWPMLGAGFTVNLLERGEASAGRIAVLMRTMPDVYTENPLPAPPAQGRLEFKSVTFTYPERENAALRSLSFSLEPGEWLGITGPVGSGKSTIWQVMARLFPVREDMVFLDGLDVVNYDPNVLRSRIALAPQDSFLFSESIRDNISFSRDHFENDWFDAVVRATTLDRDVKIFPDSWETEVGEKGISLSGGQRQRVALARALLADLPVLVLDDSFANVDAETERFMIERIRGLRRSKTTIIISHRISAMEACDRVLVLVDGSVSQEGSHAQLSRTAGYYQDVWLLQGGSVLGDIDNEV